MPTRSVESSLESVLEGAWKIASAPEEFARPSKLIRSQLRDMLQGLCEHAPEAEFSDSLGLPSTLVTKGVDAEQIWEQIEIRSVALLKEAAISIKEAESILETTCDIDSENEKEDEFDVNKEGEPSDDNDDVDEDDISDGSLEEEQEMDLEEAMEPAARSEADEDEPMRESASREVKEDMFFNADEMDNFADEYDEIGDDEMLETNQEKDEESDSESSEIDFFSSAVGDGDDSGNCKHDDFFDDDHAAGGQASGDPKAKSWFERSQDLLQEQIEDMEQQNQGGRPWHLMGEVSSRSRPQDSLLETHVEVEMADKQAPVITEEVTMALEDIIRRRIADANFDDVERVEEQRESRRSTRMTFNDEKSTLGLGEVYAKEFEAKVAATKNGGEVVDSGLAEQHREIEELFVSLSHELDSLSSFRFVPAPPAAPSTETLHVPAINMEEAVPLAASSAFTAAPENIHRPARDGLPTGETEITREERRKKRRANKERSRKKAAQTPKPAVVVEQADPATKGGKKGKKNAEQQSTSALATSSEATNYNKSTSVFRKLNDEAAGDQKRA